MISQQPGIYQIRNTANGNQYVGSAASLRRRWYEHSSRLRRGAHDNRYLQRAWDKYGEAAFAFEPLFICAKGMLVFYEQRALDVFQPEYNLSPTAGNSLGVRHTEETCARMSASRRGLKQSPAAIAKRAASLRGKKRTQETKDKMRALATGRPVSEATKAKLRVANLGKKASPETRSKISAGNTGKPCGPQGPLSEAHKAAISKAGLGRKLSEEAKASMSIAAKARVQKWKACLATIAAAMYFNKLVGGNA